MWKCDVTPSITLVAAALVVLTSSPGLFGGPSPSPTLSVSAGLAQSTAINPTGPVPFWSPVEMANTPPTPDRTWAFTYDAHDGYDVFLEYFAAPGYAYQAQTWTFSNGVWTNRTSTVGVQPPCCALAPMVYDSADQALVFLVADYASGAPNVQTWAYSAGAWSRTATGSPPAPTSPRGYTYDLADDAADGYVLLFGGAVSGPCAPAGICGLLQDTWSYRSGVWTNLTPSLGSSPPPDYCWYFPAGACSAMTYAQSARAVVLFGVGYSAMNETWQFAGGKWANVTATSGPAPPPRVQPNFAYDARDNLSLVSGGFNIIANGGNETWAYESGRWVLLRPSLDPMIQGTCHTEGVTFDGTTGRLLLLAVPWGGECGTSGAFELPVEVWQFQVSVLPPPPSIQSFSASPPVLVLGSRLTLSVAASGGVGPLNHSFTGLPPGCPAANTSLVSCVPISSGSFLTSVTVFDLANRSASAQVTVTVLSVLDVVLIAGGLLAVSVGVFIVIRRFRRRRRTSPTRLTAAPPATVPIVGEPPPTAPGSPGPK